MYAFSNKIDIPAGSSLGGYADQIHAVSTRAAQLEVHGFGVGEGTAGWEICSVDALYAGVLADSKGTPGFRRVFAASHTHFAPMLDAAKPDIGIFSETASHDFLVGIEGASRVAVSPNVCEIFSGDVQIPVYRRFDFPSSTFNRFLTQRAGFFPNEKHPVDRSVKIFLFSHDDAPLYAFVYHACHPVTRADAQEVSADYVQALRDAVTERFGVTICLFFLGCAADVRPNLGRKRREWLPKNRLNWRFKYPPTIQDQAEIDMQYRTAVKEAKPMDSFPITSESFRLCGKKIALHGGAAINVPQLHIGGRLIFSFLPFEVSHRYHLETLVDTALPRKFIVSCADNTQGYLPHSSQMAFGGYEVDSSRAPMKLDQRVQMNGSDLW